MNAARWLSIGCLLICRAGAQTQPAESEPAAVVELGGATSRSLSGSGGSGGADFAIEFTPIENWLEMEAGTTPLFSRHSKEWDTDLLFKKPWDLTKKLEFMAGIGPEWVHTRQNGITTNSVAGEAVADFMFWPWAKHRIGWFVEPGFDYSFARGHERSLGISGGLLIGIPRPRKSD